jgi:hypothetical protein
MIRFFSVLAMCFLTIFSASNCWAAPTMYLPASHRVYPFLERMELQGLISGAHLGARPLTRARVAELLLTVKKSDATLSPADREEFRCLLDEFRPDMPGSDGALAEDKGPVDHIPGFLSDFLYHNRRNLWSARGENYSLYLDPVIVRSAKIESLKTSAKDDRTYISGNGFTTRGTVGEHLGFFIDVRDSKEWGSRYYTPDTSTTMPGRGFVSFKGDRAEFDETNASLTYTSGPFVIQYGRGKNIWGHGERGTLGLSGFAAPYDQFKFETEFWRLRYTFIAAELAQYPPIAQFYYNTFPSDSVTVQKRYSAHRLDIDLTRRVNVGLYEAVVYGGRWDLDYLNPVMFLRSAEHSNDDHDNAIMGLDFRILAHRSVSVYGELLIDDITTGKLGTDWYGNKLGYQLGTLLTEPFRLRDMDARIEYTRVKPWVYTHTFPINTYSQYGSTLGYPTGPNSDELSLEIRKRFSRRLHASLLWLRYRHGSNPPGVNLGGDIFHGHYQGDTITSTFLNGIRERRNSIGMDISYEPLWQTVIRAGYTYEDRDGKANHSIRFSFGVNE